MTPAEWLALVVVCSFVYNVLEHLIDPSAIRMTVNNSLAGAIRLAFSVAIIVLALIVLF
jgi:hypothetical protein